VSTHRWPDLYRGSWLVTGNVAKVKVLHELQRRIKQGTSLAILDVGIVGPQPLEFWEPLLTRYVGSFHLTGVDVQGIDRAAQVVDHRGWKEQVTLRHGSGYSLAELFPPASFDLLVATQVLEHVARLHLFLEQVAAVMKPGAEAFFTIDSAHYQSRYDPRQPIRLAKNLLKKGLSLAGHEVHYDLPWHDAEVIRACEAAGLTLVDCRYYNLHPIKFLHNHVVPSAHQNAFAGVWFDLEECLNVLQEVRSALKPFCMALYLHVRRA
jgi:2-polyprenyl-3-methyl-5-hydroxy-6-metoxy-1,4-benzoquinol methylase